LSSNDGAAFGGGPPGAPSKPMHGDLPLLFGIVTFACLLAALTLSAYGHRPALMLPLALAASRGIPALDGRLAPVAAAGVLDTLANVLFAVAATTGQLAVVAVLGSLYPAVTVVLAWIFLRERIGRVQVAGILLALAGVLVIAAG